MDLNLWKQRKKELHLNYDKIAELTGLPKSTVTNIFLGYVTAPRIDTVEAIEKVLGINGLTPEEIKAGASTLINKNITAEEFELLNIYKEIGEQLGSKAQKAFLAIGENMLNIK